MTDDPIALSQQAAALADATVSAVRPDQWALHAVAGVEGPAADQPMSLAAENRQFLCLALSVLHTTGEAADEGLGTSSSGRRKACHPGTAR